MRRGLGWLFAITALTIALGPWIGVAVPSLDRLAVALPAAPLLAIAALLCRRTVKLVLIAGAALCVSGVPLVREAWPATVGDEAPAGSARLVVVSHNVADANVDPARTSRSLIATDADILLLQEVDGRFRPELQRLRRRFPFGSDCRKRCSVAILSRLPMGRVRYRFRDAANRPVGPPLVQGVVTIAGRRVTIVSIHLTRGSDAATRAGQRAALADAVRGVPDPALILGGDFNLVPYQASFRRLGDDLQPLVRADRGLFTFPARWDTRPVPWPLVDIDHVFAGPAWIVAAARRLPKTGSDHYPIRVDLVLRPSAL
ncbi:endonuclease/exonuclease/phosphatase family protein [Sphingomonas montana]|uniref:endonuclease/exonuclease/phosphatase family protein n=1 Tax=Sphingomonas montana TaxID=1843236 RepID=UPI00096D6804|nr:endonuclease/exonuclease/phosphatase family protein [Sphingomonas montana]